MSAQMSVQYEQYMAEISHPHCVVDRSAIKVLKLFAVHHTQSNDCKDNKNGTWTRNCWTMQKLSRFRTVVDERWKHI